MTIEINPFPRQWDGWERLLDSTTKFVAYGGAAGGGKSWLGWEWLLVMCLQYPGSRWFVGRQELKRLRTSTLETFFKVVRHYGFTGYRYNGQDHFITIGQSRIDLLELKYYPSDPLYERFGSMEFTGGWIEEGGEVHEGAFEVLKSRIGRQNEFTLEGKKNTIIPKMFVTCNPKKNWIESVFYRPFINGTLPKDHCFIRSLVTDNPYASEDYINSLKNIKNKAQRKRLFDGDFDYDDDPYLLFDYDATRDMFTNNYIFGDDLMMTIDVARFGDDLTVLLVWEGWRIVDAIVLEESSVPSVISAANELKRDYEIPNSKIVVDADGVGGGVADGLRGSRHFYNGGKPVKKGNWKWYQNKKAQCYDIISQKVNAGEVAIDPEVGELSVQGRSFESVLVEELGAIKRKKADDDSRKFQVSTKEEIKEMIGRSPDISDSMMMRVEFELLTNRVTVL